MRTAVFVGPSLPGPSLPGAVLPAAHVRCPPIGRGGVINAVRDGYRRIALIDGVFGTEPAVSHKEILWALAQGVEIWGAASIGALRAAELDRFGMLGVGIVYENLRAGRIESDADVAVLHGPAAFGYRPLTIAMVDVAAQLDRAATDGALAASSHQRWAALARTIHFTARTWAAVIAHGRANAIPEAACSALARYVAEHPYSQKAADAEALLERLRSPSSTIVGAAVPFELHLTGWLRRDLRQADQMPSAFRRAPG